MIEQCREKGLKSVLVANYEALPFGNNTFDIILCINAIHYTKNPELALIEMNRVLKREGIVILTYFNRMNPRAAVHFIRDILKTKKNLESSYTLNALKKMLDKVGLEIIEYTGCNFLPFASDSKKRSELSLKVFRSLEKKIRKTFFNTFCDEVIVKARKKS